MELSHIICAVDLGAWTMKLAALNNNHKFQIIVNQANFRQTPTVLSFTNAERLIGDQAVTKIKSNFKNTIRSPQRLIGIAKKPHIIEEQMKYSTTKYRLEQNSILFQIEQGSHKCELSAQQLAIALMTKIKFTFQSNALKTDFLFISIQSYLNNAERKALKSCAECAGFKNVNLVQQWQAIAAEYFFVRQKQIEALHQQVIVIFVDLGYTNFFVHACIISSNKLSLVDQQCLRFTGSKNIDLLLAQFYFQLIKKQTGKDIRENPKALVKLLEAVESQRKKLSANTQNQLVIQCLLGDYDLSYNMTREQLQNISMPVLAELASSMQGLRSRVQPIAPIYSIQIIGGVSRMPFMQQIVKSVFNMEAHKKMNASQSVARGASIVGASRLGLIKANMFNFVRNIRFPIFILSHNISTDNKIYGRDLNNFKKCEKKIVFDTNSIIPANSILKIQGQKNQILICQQGFLQTTIIGYLSFNGSDNLTILIDNDGILRARLMKNNNFDNYDLGELITLQKLNKYRQQQQKMKQRDRNILQSYEIRNQFQSFLYNTKQNMNNRWAFMITPEQVIVLMDILEESQKFLADSNDHNTQNFKQRIQALNMIIEPIKTRENAKK